MDFFLSPFLWLLPLSFIPLIFHLLNSRKFETIEFSSVELIESLKAKSIKRLSIINILLLIIRMLIIAFLILSISRPVIKIGNSSILEDHSTMSIVIVIDDTFSNANKYVQESLEDKVKEKIQTIVENYNEMNYLEVASINKDLLYKGFIRDFDLNSIQIKHNYKYGNISSLLSKYFSTQFTDEYSFGHMYVISDMQKTTLGHNFGSDWWDVVFVDSDIMILEPLISKITVDDKVVFPMKPFSVTMEVLNNGEVDFENVKAYLYVDGIQLVQNFDILKTDSKKIEFKSIVDKRGSFDVWGEIKLGGKKVGNKYFTKVNVFPRIDICFCQLQNLESAKYLKASISAIADNDTFLINDCSTSLGDLNLYDIIVIDDYKLLDQEEVILYLNDGGHILFFPGSYVYDSFSFDLLEGEAYLNSNEIALFKNDVIADDILEGIFKQMNDDVVFSVKKKYLLPLSNKSLIKASNKGALWNRVYTERGLLDIFGFNFNIKDNDFALKAFFVPFIYSLLTSHNKVYPAEFFLGDEHSNYYNQANQKLSSVQLSGGKDYREFFNNSKELNFDNIQSPGFYFLLSKNDTIEELVFNISPNELFQDSIDFQILEQRYDSATLINSDQDLAAFIKRRLNPAEIWHLFLAIAIILLIIESIIINVFSREK